MAILFWKSFFSTLKKKSEISVSTLKPIEVSVIQVTEFQKNYSESVVDP